MIPKSVDNRGDLLRVIEALDAEARRAEAEFEAQSFERLKLEIDDPTVRDLVELAEGLKIQCEDQRRKLAAMAGDLKMARTGEADARRDLALALDTVLLQVKLIEAQNGTMATLKFEVAKLRALEPSPDPVVEVLPAPSPFFVGQPAVFQPDNRSTLDKVVDGYFRAWRNHPGWMSIFHVAGLALATQRSENRALRLELDDAIDDHDEILDGLWAAQNENEALAEEVEVKAQAVKKAEAEREAMESRPTTEVIINEAPGFTDGELDALGDRLEGQVDRSVQAEMRANRARYRGPKGDRGTAGKQGRSGQDGEIVQRVEHVHHSDGPSLKSNSPAVEVRREVVTLKPRTPRKGPGEGAKRLIDGWQRRKDDDSK